jgi:hypothetical protein
LSWSPADPVDADARARSTFFQQPYRGMYLHRFG